MVFTVSGVFNAVENGAVRAVRPRLGLSGGQPCVSAAAQRAGHPRGRSQTGGVFVSPLRQHSHQHLMITVYGNVAFFSGMVDLSVNNT